MEQSGSPAPSSPCFKFTHCNFFVELFALLCLCCPVSRPVRVGLEEASADTVVYFNINLILVNTDTKLAKAKIAAMSLKFMFGQIKSVL